MRGADRRERAALLGLRHTAGAGAGGRYAVTGRPAPLMPDLDVAAILARVERGAQSAQEAAALTAAFARLVADVAQGQAERDVAAALADECDVLRGALRELEKSASPLSARPAARTACLAAPQRTQLRAP